MLGDRPGAASHLGRVSEHMATVPPSQHAKQLTGKHQPIKIIKS